MTTMFYILVTFLRTSTSSYIDTSLPIAKLYPPSCTAPWADLEIVSISTSFDCVQIVHLSALVTVSILSKDPIMHNTLNAVDPFSFIVIT
ncbi:hypothetical protein K449DRAFT_242849 [Hypoxylon sp. EC38]|nr:hypothetical protein K449DRAFT_242849 [Hypoxylon sp. EC38]